MALKPKTLQLPKPLMLQSDAEAAENKVKTLEERVKELEYELQSAKIAEQRAEKAVEHHEERLKIVTGKNSENDARAEQAERDVKRLTLELGNAERALQEQVEKLNNFYQEVKKSDDAEGLHLTCYCS